MPLLHRWTRAIIAFGMMLLSAPLWAGPIVGQIDMFSGSTDGWSNGAPAPDPVVIPGGGPGGAGDSFLQITATGAGAGGRLTVFNRSQWAGNYLAAGVAAVDLDLKNFGNSTLSIRLGLKSATANGSPGFASTLPFTLPADSAWHHAVFFLDAADLTPIGAPPALDSLLSNVAELRILHATAPALNGTPIVSQLGVDNIRADASASPEPSPTLLVISGVGLLAWLERVRRGKRPHRPS